MFKLLGRFVVGLCAVALTAGAGAGLAVVPFGAAPAGAATTLTVTTGADPALTSASCPATETNPCSLRAAIAVFNAGTTDVTIDLPEPSTLTPPAGVYTVSADIGNLEINNTTPNVSLTITGQCTHSCDIHAQAGTTVTTVDMNVFQVDLNTTVSMSGLTIEGGRNTAGQGGGILNNGTLQLSACIVTDNTTTSDGGGIAQDDSGAALTISDSFISQNTASDGSGGGIYAQGGTVNVTNSTIGGTSSQETDGNSASFDGGGVALIGAAGTFSGDTIGGTTSSLANTAGSEGGGLYVTASDPSFTDVTITDNTAASAGGGVYIDGQTNTFAGGTISDNKVTGSDGGGGGVYINNGTNTFSGTTISSNQVTGSSGQGGGVYIDGGINTFSGDSINSNVAGDTSLSDSGDGGGLYVNSGTNTFTNTTVDSNQAIWTGSDGQGGGFYYDDGINTFTGGSIDSNQAYAGGGAFLNFGTETFTQTDISSNRVTEAGGGLWIFITDTSDPVTVTSSTISRNTVQLPPLGTSFDGDGGGILVQDCNLVNLTNDTIAGNTADLLGGGYFGAGCTGTVAGVEKPAVEHGANPHVVVPPTTNFVFDTVDSNTSGEDAGNITTTDASVLNASQTIVSNGVGGGIIGNNCTFLGTGTLTSLGYNLIDDTTCGTAAATDIIGQSPQLGALANNGGPTETLLPADSAPEVGAIPDATCVGTGVGLDQRGVARGAGANSSCTIGSVEVGQNFNGYRLVANEGGIFDFGLLFSGSLANNHLNAPIVGLANAPGPAGYLMVGGDGGVFALGGANFFGSLGGQAIPSPIAAIAAPPNETGYWLVAQNGKIYNYGSVPALPALSPPSVAHIVGMASTTDGQGAWLVDNLGDVYAEGDAQYEGGLGGVHINKPIVGIAAAASGQGYVLVASDGGAFTYGTQLFYGSVPGSLKPGQNLNAPIVGIAVTHSGKGYWEVGSDGGVFTYGDAPFLGSMAGVRLNGPVVGIQHLGSVTAPA